MNCCGFTGGIQSWAQGGSFRSGFFSGGVSSGIGSLTSGWSSEAQLFSGVAAGGLASLAGGGNFWDGVKTGAITVGLNHLGHSLAQGGSGDPDPKERERFVKFLKAEPEAGNTTLRKAQNALVLYDKGTWGLIKHVLWNNKTDLTLSMIPGGAYINGSAKILLKGTDNIIDLAKFSKGKYKHWKLVKDRAAGKTTAHGGSFYKLTNTHTNAMYILDVNGKLLR